MKKYFVIIFLVLIESVIYWYASAVSLADTPLAKEVSISQIKITGDEFLVLHNNTPVNLPLGNFWLQYFNDFNLANSGVTNSSAQLPSVNLQPGQEILLAVGTAANCGPVWVSKLPFSLKDSAGTLQVISLSQSSGIIGYKPEDQVSWSSKSTDPVDIKPVSTTATAQIWNKPGSVWQASATPPGCTAISATNSTATNTPDTLSKSSSSPPSVLFSQSNENASTSKIPAADAGLMAPQLSELLPNPESPKTDANDEYIELYNPNDKPFDLGGFILKTGPSSTYSYTFPSGQFTLQPHEFKSFYSSTTGLSLSNSTSKAQLLSPDNQLLAESDIYSDAKDGYGWILADGLWQWTSVSTPNERNVIETASAAQNSLSINHSALPAATVLSKTYPVIQISEVLPNPKSPQTDAKDEFIELYNPGSQPVDLSGYVLVTGSKDDHKYTISSGSIDPKSYTAFFSSTTHLALSNSGGHVKLLSPGGTVIDATSDYSKAAEGESWIFSGGKWQWTSVPTAGKANILNAVAVKSAGTTARSAGTTNIGQNNSSASPQSGPAKTSLHPLILAGIGAVAVIYALYEYRHDMANYLYRFRRNRAVGRAAGQVAEPASSFRTLL